MTFFLKIKHWKLFLFLYIPSLMMGVLFMNLFLSTISHTSINRFVSSLSLISIYYLLVYTRWLYSIGMFTTYKLKKEKSIQSKVFNISLNIFSLLLIISSIGIISILYIGIDNSELIENAPKYLLKMILILYIISALFLFFWIYFSAFNLKRIEGNSQQKLDLSTLIAEIFLIAMFPLGLWFIQPRVNKIYKMSENYGKHPRSA